MTYFASTSLLLGVSIASLEAQTAPLATNAAQVSATTTSGPQIQFAEPVHDFGKLEYGKVLTNFFVFSNTGDRVLELQDVISSCGCVVAQNWDRRVEPGKSGMIPVIFTASGIGAEVMKPIRIVCNDPAQSNVVLYVQASIYKPIDAVPPVAVFSFGPDFQTNQTKVIRLLSNLEEPISISDPVCTNHMFRAEVRMVKPGKEFEVLITVVPPLGAGSWVGPVTLKTSTPKMPVVSVSGYAMVQPALKVEPAMVVLPPMPLTEAAQFDVAIQNLATNALVLSEPAINATGASVALSEVQPGRLFNLRVSFPAGFQSSAKPAIHATVKSNQAQSPVIKVAFTQPEPETEAAPAAGPEKTPTDAPSQKPATPSLPNSAGR